jgi:hypothetical protein
MATSSAAVLDRWFVDGDIIARWQYEKDALTVRLVAAWHRSSRREHGHQPSTDRLPQRLNAYVPSADSTVDPTLAAACNDDVDDAYPNIPNCPVPIGWFATGGAGQLINATSDRPSLTADGSYRLGTHALMIGATVEDSRLVNDFRFSGGSYQRSLFPGHLDVERYLVPGSSCTDDLNVPCDYVDTVAQTFRARYLAAYTEDTWTPLASLRINAGLRWESMQLGNKVNFSAQFAPRASVSWDPLGAGRSRVFVSVGRSFAYLPLGVAQGLAPVPATAREVSSQFGQIRTVDGTGGYGVAINVSPIVVDEMIAGAQFGLQSFAEFKAWVQSRWQRSTLETTVRGWSNLDNARYGDDQGAKRSLMASAEIASSATNATVVRLGYQWGQTLGATAGAFDPAQGEILYAGRDFDGAVANLFGGLPNDPGHRLYMELSRRWQVAGTPVTLGARAVVSSGRLQSIAAQTSDGWAFLLPRGDAGRAPMQTVVNIKAATQVSGMQLSLEVFNLFDRRSVVTTDEIYTRSSVLPIDGGRRSDLLFLRTENGDVIRKESGYGLATSFQSPVFVLLGLTAKL